MTGQEVRRCLQAFGVPADNPFDDLLGKLDSIPGAISVQTPAPPLRVGSRQVKAAAAA